MTKSIELGDKIAVGMSIACAIHCFALPILVSLAPSIQALSIDTDEGFHYWMMFAVLPTSIFTLVMGCKKHKRPIFLVIGCVGLCVMAFAALWGHQLLGCHYERYVTLAGATTLSLAHINNFRLCKKQQCLTHEGCSAS